MLVLHEPHINSLLKTREIHSNKSSHGHALLLAGNTGRMGAAVIASRACLRSGLGLLTVCVPKEERAIVQISVPEAMLIFREEVYFDFGKYSAIGIGPAMETDEEAKQKMELVLSRYTKPLVIDADALTLLAENPEFALKLPANCILTPHQGEFDRLFGQHDSQEQRWKTAQRKAQEWKAIFVMKGPNTVIVTATQMFQNTTGNAGLAKGGSGDALTGMICSFLAQGYEPDVAAQIAVYLHGLAADLALEKQSMESLMITDVIEYIGPAFDLVRD